MGVASSNIAKIQQNFYNNVIQNEQSSCISTTASSANDNVITVNGTKINGNFTGVSQNVTTDATCLIVSTMEDAISNILSAKTAQTNSAATDAFNDFSWTETKNSYNLNQSTVNNISQLLQSTCSANTTVSTNSNYIYITDSTIGGNFVGVTNTANSSANCNMTNLMKNVTYNQAQAVTTQNNTVKGMFVAIITAIAIIIGLIVVAVIIIFSAGALRSVGVNKKNNTPLSGASLSPLTSPNSSLDGNNNLNNSNNTQNLINGLNNSNLNNLLNSGNLNNLLNSGNLNNGNSNNLLNSGNLNNLLAS